MPEYQWGVRSLIDGTVIEYTLESNARLAYRMLNMADMPHELVRRPIADWEVMKPSNHWVFTFGAGHTHPETGLPLAGRFVLAPEGLDYEGARAWMVARFSTQWCAQYDATDDRDPAGIKEFGLTPLEDAEIPEARG